MVGNAFLRKAVVASEVIADAGRMVQMGIMQGKKRTLSVAMGEGMAKVDD